MTLRSSVPVFLLLLDETYSEICQKKNVCQGVVREIHLSDLADTLLHVFLIYKKNVYNEMKFKMPES